MLNLEIIVYMIEYSNACVDCFYHEIQRQHAVDTQYLSIKFNLVTESACFELLSGSRNYGDILCFVVTFKV